MTLAPAPLPTGRWFDRWTAVQLLAVIAVLLLLVGLVAAPSVALPILWYGVVPLLPATFFLNTRLWRSVCPLATFNSWGNGIATPRQLTPQVASRLAVAGLLLFHLLVPARRFLFNTDGAALAVTVAAVVLLAISLGAVFPVRSAFCNALCPVLPVEQLYGQAPLLAMARGRCPACTTCTPRGCLDLAGGKALVQVIGPARRSLAWLATPHGLFIAALPGFIVGYSLLADGALATAPQVYATTLGASVTSVALVAAMAATTRLASARLFPLIGGTAGILYYWFAGPAIATACAADTRVSTTVRALGIGLAALWLWRAWRATPSLS